ncbi:MAG: hypothetical protein P8X74_11475 [Reinekea sp.]
MACALRRYGVTDSGDNQPAKEASVRQLKPVISSVKRYSSVVSPQSIDKRSADKDVFVTS